MVYAVTKSIADTPLHARIFAAFEADFMSARPPRNLALFTQRDFGADADHYLLFAPSLDVVPLTAATVAWEVSGPVDDSEQWSLLIGNATAFEDFGIMRPKDRYRV